MTWYPLFVIRLRVHPGLGSDLSHRSSIWCDLLVVLANSGRREAAESGGFLRVLDANPVVTQVDLHLKLIYGWNLSIPSIAKTFVCKRNSLSSTRHFQMMRDEQNEII